MIHQRPPDCVFPRDRRLPKVFLLWPTRNRRNFKRNGRGRISHIVNLKRNGGEHKVFMKLQEWTLRMNTMAFPFCLSVVALLLRSHLRLEIMSPTLVHLALRGTSCTCRNQDMQFRHLEKEWRRVDNKRRRVEEKTQQVALLARLAALMGGFQVAMFINQGFPSTWDLWPSGANQASTPANHTSDQVAWNPDLFSLCIPQRT
jgi:hypothetical protein